MFGRFPLMSLHVTPPFVVFKDVAQVIPQNSRCCGEARKSRVKMFPVESPRFVLMLVMKRVERPVPGDIGPHSGSRPCPRFNVRQTLPLVVAATTILLSFGSASIRH